MGRDLTVNHFAASQFKVPYGDRVWVENEGNKGTTVCFTLASRKGRKE